MKKTKYIALIISVLALSLAAGYLAIAWTDPAQPPPGDNVDAPINIGSISQTKTGGLNIMGRLDLQGGLLWISNPTASNRIEIGQGITSNQYAYIDLKGDATNYTDYGLRLLRGNTGANTWSDLVHRGTGELRIRAVEAAPLSFWTSNSRRMYITSGGNVGIGTTGPAGKLHVRSSYDSTVGRANYIYLDDSTNTNLKGYIGINRNTAAGADKEYMSIEFLEETVHWGPLVLQKDGGNVGIGTTAPSQKLDVVGYVKGRSGLCIGNDCRNVWPGGGSGINLSCSSGQVIKGATVSSGSLTAGSCAADDTGGGGGGGTMSSWDLYEDGTFRDQITDTEDVGFDSGTGITVSWDGSRDVGFSLVDATKGCSAGNAIQSFDLSGTGNPTCVATGGVSNVTWDYCNVLSSNSSNISCSVTCGTKVRTGCSGQYSVTKAGWITVWTVQPAANGCSCNLQRVLGIVPPTMSMWCWAFCAE